MKNVAKLAPLVLALLLAGCSGPSASEKMMDRQIEEGTGGDASVDMKADGNMRIQTEDGTMTTGNSLPADWPKDVQVYAGAEVQWSGVMDPVTGKPGSAAMMMSGDDHATVLAFYKNAMQEDGWAIQSTMNIGGSTMVIARKENRMLSLTLAATGEGTSITLGVGEES